MNSDELMAIKAAMKGEPAPPHIYDECGIAAKAIEIREWQRRREWYENYNDENPY